MERETAAWDTRATKEYERWDLSAALRRARKF
jgi:hypothetical protein